MVVAPTLETGLAVPTFTLLGIFTSVLNNVLAVMQSHIVRVKIYNH